MAVAAALLAGVGAVATAAIAAGGDRADDPAAGHGHQRGRCAGAAGADAGSARRGGWPIRWWRSGWRASPSCSPPCPRGNSPRSTRRSPPWSRWVRRPRSRSRARCSPPGRTGRPCGPGPAQPGPPCSRPPPGRPRWWRSAPAHRPGSPRCSGRTRRCARSGTATRRRPLPQHAGPAAITLGLLAVAAGRAALIVGGRRYVLAAALPPVAALALVLPTALGAPRPVTAWVALAVVARHRPGRRPGRPTDPAATRSLRGTAAVVCALTGGAGIAGSLATPGPPWSRCVIAAFAARADGAAGSGPGRTQVAWLVAIAGRPRAAHDRVRRGRPAAAAQRLRACSRWRRVLGGRRLGAGPAPAAARPARRRWWSWRAGRRGVRAAADARLAALLRGGADDLGRRCSGVAALRRDRAPRRRTLAGHRGAPWRSWAPAGCCSTRSRSACPRRTPCRSPLSRSWPGVVELRRRDRPVAAGSRTARRWPAGSCRACAGSCSARATWRRRVALFAGRGGLLVVGSVPAPAAPAVIGGGASRCWSRCTRCRAAHRRALVAGVLPLRARRPAAGRPRRDLREAPARPAAAAQPPAHRWPPPSTYIGCVQAYDLAIRSRLPGVCHHPSAASLGWRRWIPGPVCPSSAWWAAASWPG